MECLTSKYAAMKLLSFYIHIKNIASMILRNGSAFLAAQSIMILFTLYSTILQPFRQDMQCGCCDERLYWHPKTNQWFCRKCGMWAKPLQAEEISATIAEKLCWLRQNPEIIHNPEGQANVQSVEVALLDREIWQALTNAEPDVDALVAKILHRAELEYKFCTAGDADPATLLIQKACTEYVPTEGFPETFYKEVVSKVILYRDNHLELKLQNGQIV